METLPVEIIERIVQQLTPQDLARCSAVSREWHEIFNEDWMWKPHCDPELEEPLQTIPCVATPAFVAPEAGNSTLSPISHWKLAFMRENHLWKNWRRKEIMITKEKLNKCENEDIAEVGFLTDTLVVVWYADQIKILDVRTIPATVVAKTDSSVQIGDADYSVSGTTMLLVETQDSLEIFNVDTINKSIKLKRHFDLELESDAIIAQVVKEDMFLHAETESSKLVTIDINTGKTLREEPCPVVLNKNERAEIWEIASSPTCDFVAVTFAVYHPIDGNECCKYYIYSPKEGKFSPDPVADRPGHWSNYSVCLHGHWLALMGHETLTVYNFHTQEVIFRVKDIDDTCGTCECYNGFVFSCREKDQSYVKYCSPLNRTLVTLHESSEPMSFRVFGNKFIAIFQEDSRIFYTADDELVEDSVSESVWKCSGQKVEKCDVSVRQNWEINQSCTRMLNSEVLNGKRSWYVSCLW